jgi:hypothetical protein
MLLEAVEEGSRGLLSCRDSVITIVSGGNRIQLGAWPDFIVVSG